MKIGGVGRPVIGRLHIANPDVAIDLPCKNNFLFAHSIVPRPRTNFTTARQFEEWNNRPDVKQARQASHSYRLNLSPDGSFRMEEVLPGKYEMSIRIHDPRDPNAMAYSKYIIDTTKTFEVPESNDRGPLDLGVFEIHSKPDFIIVGRPAPEFEATDMAGQKFKLSDYRGKYVLLDFWGDLVRPMRPRDPVLQRSL
jgi:hypothetical protein